MKNIIYPKWLDYTTWETPRWQAALSRRSLSMPMRLALEHGIIKPELKLLDFGSGKNYCNDIQHLKQHQIEAIGFDPYWNRQPNFNYELGLLQPTNIISCIYVINLIETEKERAEVLKYCWQLTVRSLVVIEMGGRSFFPPLSAVRTDKKQSGLTSIGTYQKYYTQLEFRDFIAQTLGVVRVSFPKSGVAFIHK